MIFGMGLAALYNAAYNISASLLSNMQGNVSLNAEQIHGLKEYQIQGLRVGLSKDQVNHDWFSYAHAEAAEKGIPYEAYAGLNYDQVGYGILQGLTCEQLEGLDQYQIQGLHAGLSKEQVNHKWFEGSHAEAARKGIPYETYAGLSNVQVGGGILQGLSREQVNHEWFSVAHADAAREGIPYETYAGLSDVQVGDGILQGLTREQVEGLFYWQIKGVFAGLSREQVNHSWFGSNHVNAAGMGIPYKVYAHLPDSEVEKRVADYEAAKARALKFQCLSKEQLGVLGISQILAVVNHGMTFGQVVALEGLRLDAAICEHRAQQKLALCLAHHSKMEGKAPKALQIDDIYNQIKAFVGGKDQPVVPHLDLSVD
ncbi:MAG: hypothetical protein K0R66_513 [Gammaproteobacteria bacterium]|jgi:hypothetical protein|nr:hypothetical protein [Gammaproteobacteria bacterium]